MTTPKRLTPDGLRDLLDHIDAVSVGTAYEGRNMSLAAQGHIVALEAEIAERDVLIRWLTQTVHQAHHDGPIEQCPKTTCSAIRAALREREPGR
jgi:hypothetical protein